jgi:phosphopantothenoylcysteine decarboxylase
VCVQIRHETFWKAFSCVCGFAYKAADIASKLTKLERSVHVVMTAGATQFVTPLTLQTLSRHPVTTNIFDEKMSWHPGHIELADKADLVLIAPAAADILARHPSEACSRFRR